MTEDLTQYPVVILPGWLLPAGVYSGLEKELTAKGFRVYTVDFPGFKQRSLGKILNLTDYVKYLNKFIKQQKLKNIIFIAHSFGGRVALKLLSQNSKLGRALILTGTPGFPEVGNWRRQLTRIIAALGKPVTYVPPFLFFRRKIRHLFYQLNRSPDYLRVTGNLKATFQNIVKEQLINYMDKIRIPTLLLWGEKDRLVSTRTARRMQKIIRDASLEIVPNLGHMFIYMEPEIAVRNIIRFLRTI